MSDQVKMALACDHCGLEHPGHFLQESTREAQHALIRTTTPRARKDYNGPESIRIKSLHVLLLRYDRL